MKGLKMNEYEAQCNASDSLNEYIEEHFEEVGELDGDLVYRDEDGDLFFSDLSGISDGGSWIADKTMLDTEELLQFANDLIDASQKGGE